MVESKASISFRMHENLSAEVFANYQKIVIKRLDGREQLYWRSFLRRLHDPEVFSAVT